MYTSCKHINKDVAEFFIYCLHISIHMYSIYTFLLISVPCWSLHVFLFPAIPPPTSRAKTRRSSSQESLRGTGAKRVGWGCHHWPTWQHQLNPCLAHLQWYELSPGASMRHAGRFQKPLGFFPCFLASKTCGKIPKTTGFFFHVFCWMNLVYQLSSSWNSPTFWDDSS